MDAKSGLPVKWIGYIKNTIAKVACDFTTNRMLTDYCNQYYIPQCERYNSLAADSAAVARQIAAWKQNVRNEWNNIRLESYLAPEASYSLTESSKLHSEVVLDLGRLKPEDIGVEIVFTTTDAKGKQHLSSVSEYTLISYEDGKATYRVEVFPERTGMYQVGTRYYPKNPMLPHRQDFPLVKWL